MDGPLMAAIKKRKGQMMLKEGDHQDMNHSQDSDKDLHGFVAGLKDHEKGKLMEILHNDAKGDGDGGAQTDDAGIAKGQPSSEEKEKIGNAIDDENMKHGLEAEADLGDHDYPTGGTAHSSPHVDSDEIGKSMLDSRFARGTGPSKPRNLSDRVKMNIASNLKAKGKL